MYVKGFARQSHKVKNTFLQGIIIMYLVGVTIFAYSTQVKTRCTFVWCILLKAISTGKMHGNVLGPVS